MAVPVLTVDAALGNSPGDAAYTWKNIHTDGLLQVVRGMTYGRGRQHELTRMETGTATLGIKDPKSDWDPDNTASIHYPNARAYVPIRARATIAGTTYPLFSHYLERKPRTRRIRDVYTERTFTTVDGFEWLARAGLSSSSFAAQVSSSRVSAVLNDISWSSTLRDIGTGQANLPVYAPVATDGAKALTHLLNVADWENGLFFIDAQGRAAFVGRHQLIASPFTVSQVTFRDAEAGGGGYPVIDAVPADDLDTTFNEWSGTRTGGVTQVASDTTAKGLYGERSQQFTSEVTSDADVLSQAQWKLAQFKDPLNRIESLTVMPGTDTAFWQAVLGLEIGERITYKERPPGWSLAKTADYVIQSIRATVPDGPVSKARFTFGLWPASTNTWFILDDVVSGKLDTGKLGY